MPRRSKYDPSVVVDDLAPDAALEERVVALRMAGLSVRGIAKRLQIRDSEVNAALADWAQGYFGPDRRGTLLAVVTARLEGLFHAYAPAAHKGDLAAANVCLKTCAHLASMHGLYTPSIAFANTSTTHMTIDARPMSGVDRLEAAINRLVSDQRAEAAKSEASPVKAEAVEAAE